MNMFGRDDSILSTIEWVTQTGRLFQINNLISFHVSYLGIGFISL